MTLPRSSGGARSIQDSLRRFVDPSDDVLDDADRRRSRVLVLMPLVAAAIIALGALVGAVMAVVRFGLGPIEPLAPKAGAVISWGFVVRMVAFALVLVATAALCRTRRYRVGGWLSILLMDAFIAVEALDGDAGTTMVIGFAIPILFTTVILTGRVAAAHGLAVLCLAIVLLAVERAPLAQFLSSVFVLAGVAILTAMVARMREHDLENLVRLRQLEQADAERLQSELRLARRVQLAMLPTEMPVVAPFEVAAFSEPAHEASGDFYDVFVVDSDHDHDLLAVAVCDVAGKGVASAMVMSATRAALRAAAARTASPAEMLTELNAALVASIPPELFVTACIAVFDPVKRTLVHSSAGHPHPLRLDGESQAATEIECFGLPLGLLADAPYRNTTTTLGTGDVVSIFSDGLVEALNNEREMYGFDRTMLDFERGVHGSEPLEHRLDAVLSSMRSFIGQRPLDDDVTVVLVEQCAARAATSDAGRSAA